MGIRLPRVAGTRTCGWLLRGQGELSVPVPSSAQRVLPMQKPLGVLLLALMLFLVVGAVSNRRQCAISREGNLEEGVRTSQRLAQALHAARCDAERGSFLYRFVLGPRQRKCGGVNRCVLQYQRNVDFLQTPPAAALKLVDARALEIRDAADGHPFASLSPSDRRNSRSCAT